MANAKPEATQTQALQTIRISLAPSEIEYSQESRSQQNMASSWLPYSGDLDLYGMSFLYF